MSFNCNSFDEEPFELFAFLSFVDFISYIIILTLSRRFDAVSISAFSPSILFPKISSKLATHLPRYMITVRFIRKILRVSDVAHTQQVIPPIPPTGWGGSLASHEAVYKVEGASLSNGIAANMSND